MLDTILDAIDNLALVALVYYVLLFFLAEAIPAASEPTDTRLVYETCVGTKHDPCPLGAQWVEVREWWR